RYFKLIALFVRATVQVQLEYRSGAIGRVIANLLSTATTLLLLWAMFQRVESVGGGGFGPGGGGVGGGGRRLELRPGAGADRHRHHHRLRGGGLALSQPQQDHDLRATRRVRRAADKAGALTVPGALPLPD